MISRHLIDELDLTIKPRFCILIQEMCIYANKHTLNLRYSSFILNEKILICFLVATKRNLLNINLHLFIHIKLCDELYCSMYSFYIRNCFFYISICLLIKMKNIISVQTLHLHINQIAKIAICGNNLTVFCTRHQL